MDEEQWLVGTDPQAMLSFLHDGGRLSERKARLFACACCRSIWDLLHDERSREAVAVSERYADGRADRRELESASEAALRAHEASLLRAPEAAWLAAHPLTRGLADSTACAAALEANFRRRQRDQGAADEKVHQAELLRDIFGPLPFRPLPPLSPSVLDWHGAAVLKLAQAIYEERSLPSGHLDAARLAVLADMLEEAGCTAADVLGHLRSPGPHVRGCWGLDLLLDKE